MKTTLKLLSGMSLVLALACGGGGSEKNTPEPPPPASALAYQNPTTSGFRLVKNASSNDTRLVLDLLGPSGTSARGVALFVSVDGAKAAWVHPTGAPGNCVAPGNVFPLGASPQMLASKVQGGVLQVGIFQKGGTAKVLGSAPILSLALDFKGAPKGPISLSTTGAKQATVLNADGTLSPITVDVGALSAQ